MADQDQKANLKITPEVAAFRYFYKEPTEKKGVKGKQ
jgi:hypothetical protein